MVPHAAAAVLLWLLLLAACHGATALGGGSGGMSWSSFPAGRLLLETGSGLPRGLVLPLNYSAAGRPRGLLRAGTLPIGGAVREG